MAEGTAVYSPNRKELDEDMKATFKHFKSCTCKLKEQAHSTRWGGNDRGSVPCQNGIEESHGGALEDNYQLFQLQAVEFLWNKMTSKEAKQLLTEMDHMKLLIFDWFWPTKMTMFNGSNWYPEYTTPNQKRSHEMRLRQITQQQSSTDADTWEDQPFTFTTSALPPALHNARDEVDSWAGDGDGFQRNTCCCSPVQVPLGQSFQDAFHPRH